MYTMRSATADGGKIHRLEDWGRRQLAYPIVDGDGHILELTTVFVEYLHDTAGSKVAVRGRSRCLATIPASARSSII